MHDEFMERCRREFEHHVKLMFEAKRGLPGEVHLVPHIGGEYFARDRRENYADLMRKVCRALVAQKWFELTAPKWAQPLPLREDEFEPLQHDADNKLQLVGYYARSLRWRDWDYNLHPPFNTFCRGVMEYTFSPRELRADPELQQMFPPQRLEGITTPLQWRSPGT